MAKKLNTFLYVTHVSINKGLKNQTQNPYPGSKVDKAIIKKVYLKVRLFMIIFSIFSFLLRIN